MPTINFGKLYTSFCVCSAPASIKGTETITLPKGSDPPLLSLYGVLVSPAGRMKTFKNLGDLGGGSGDTRAPKCFFIALFQKSCVQEPKLLPPPPGWSQQVAVPLCVLKEDEQGISQKNFLRASCRNPHPSLWPGTPPPQGSSPRPIHPTPSPGVFQVQMKHRMHHQRGPHTLNKANAHFMDGPTANLQPNALFSRLKHSSAQRNSSEFRCASLCDKKPLDRLLVQPQKIAELPGWRRTPPALETPPAHRGAPACSDAGKALELQIMQAAEEVSAAPSPLPTHPGCSQ